MDIEKQHRRLDVSDWKSEPPLRLDEYQPPRRSAPSSVIGFAGSIVLHLGLLQAVLSGIYLPKDQPPKLAQSTAGPGSVKGAPDPLILVAAAASIPGASAPSLTTPLMIRPEKLIQDLKREALPSVDLNPLTIEDEDNPSESTEAHASDAQRGRLVGIYSGQMKARIERQWRRPRSPISTRQDFALGPHHDDDYFRCQVQIVQDDQGNVQEVLLPACNGSAAWQRSLVVAIQESSPLPAPPDASVFSRTVTLTFTGFPYVAGASIDDYESERQPIVRSN